MKEEFLDYIKDIVEAMDNAQSFVKDMNFDAFVLDKKTVYAINRALEIIGEASKQIPVLVRNSYPEIPWKNMAGMRGFPFFRMLGESLKISELYLLHKN